MIAKLIWIIIFSSKRIDWRQWFKKFLAVAKKKKYHAILETDPDKLGITAEEKKKMSSTVYNDLLLAMVDDVSFSLVDEANGTDYPD